VEHLHAIARSGLAAQRAKAVEALTDLTSGPDRIELIKWVDEHLADDQAGAVRDAIARLRSTPIVEAALPELPSVRLPEVRGFGAELAELQAVVNGGAGGYSNWQMLAALVSAVER